ncbi:hypothetical protein DPMN_047687, partial [Dreissena polymorpha]
MSFANLRGTNILVKNVNARVFTNQMLTDGRQTKTNHKTSPEQSGKLPHPHGGHENNVTSRVHVIQLTGTIFELNSFIKKTNVLTKFHEHWAKNVTSRVFTCFHYIHIEKNAPPTGTILNLVRDINKTNVLTNFHDDWANMKTAPPTCGH